MPLELPVSLLAVTDVAVVIAVGEMRGQLAEIVLPNRLATPAQKDCMRTGLPRPLSDRIRHRLDMAVGRIVENQNLRHDLLLDGFAPGAPLCSTARRPLRLLNPRLP